MSIIENHRVDIGMDPDDPANQRNAKFLREAEDRLFPDLPKKLQRSERNEEKKNEQGKDWEVWKTIFRKVE